MHIEIRQKQGSTCQYLHLSFPLKNLNCILRNNLPILLTNERMKHPLPEGGFNTCLDNFKCQKYIIYSMLYDVTVVIWNVLYTWFLLFADVTVVECQTGDGKYGFFSSIVFLNDYHWFTNIRLLNSFTLKGLVSNLLMCHW